MCTKLSQKIINNKINYDSMKDYSDHARACTRSYNYTCGVSKTMRHNSITLSYSFNVMFQPTDYLAILHSYRNCYKFSQWTKNVNFVHHAGRPFLHPHYIEMDGLGIICMIVSFLVSIREIIWTLLP